MIRAKIILSYAMSGWDQSEGTTDVKMPLTSCMSNILGKFCFDVGQVGNLQADC